MMDDENGNNGSSTSTSRNDKAKNDRSNKSNVAISEEPSTATAKPNVATADAVVGGGSSGQNSNTAIVYVWYYPELKQNLQSERSISNALVAYFSHDLRVKLVNAGVSMIELDNKMYNAASQCTTTGIDNNGNDAANTATPSMLMSTRRRKSSSGRSSNNSSSSNQKTMERKEMNSNASNE